MKRRTKVVLGLLGVVVAAGAAMAVRSSDGADPEGAAVVEVTRGDLVDKALAVGTIVPDIEVEVKSKVSGVVSRRFADVGDYVRKGDPLLEIRPDPTPLELVEARRQLELREIEAANLKKDLARQATLQAQGLLSEQEYEGTQRRQAEAALQVQIARERLALLEKGRVTSANNAIDAVLRSPIDGFILEKMVEVGDPVVPLSTYQAGTALMTMADMKSLVFRGTVDEIDVGRLREGMPAEIKIGALPDARLKGALSKISLKARKEENSTATTFPIEISLTDVGAATLRAGYSASADVVIEKREKALTIPERVVTFEKDGAWVMVRTAGGGSEKRQVKTGLSDAINIEVLAGLKEGDKVLEKPEKKVE